MKKWNIPVIKELNISSTMQGGNNVKFEDLTIYDEARNTNWHAYSGSDVDKTKPGANVDIHG